MRRLWLLAICAACFLTSDALGRGQETQRISLCRLSADATTYHRHLVEVEGFVARDADKFVFFDPTCSDGPPVWLEFGGNKRTNSPYCCGPNGTQSRAKELLVDSFTIPIVDDYTLKLFSREIQPPYRSGKFGSVVRATLVGRFFQGGTGLSPDASTPGSGYGRLGCCNLLAIQEVTSVAQQDRDDLDYGATPDKPCMEEHGCASQELTIANSWDDLLKAQQQGDAGPNEFAMDDPVRVVNNFLASSLSLDAAQPLRLKEKRKAPGRIVYQWVPPGGGHSYMIVVSKPYPLSFYAKDPKHVVWVVIAAYDWSA